MRTALILMILATSPAMWMSASYSQPVERPQEEAQFANWLKDLRTEAIEAGISEATVEIALAGITPIERVIERDQNQPEFRLDFWTYLDRVASEERIEQGRRLLESHRGLLADITARHGIPGSVLVAAWGIESNFGANLGGFPVIQALVTLAHDKRRAAMFRRETIHALRILDQGHIALADMQGSWAGAMGQVQFMPSTFVDFARDGDGDGRKDIWQSTADALESAAGFMATAWQPGYIWGRQVQIPSGFDRSLSGLDTMKPIDEWQVLGVRRIDDAALPLADIQGSIVLPSEGPEPAFLIYQNYRAFFRWNRSHFFAITLGNLADRIAGHGPLKR